MIEKKKKVTCGIRAGAVGATSATTSTRSCDVAGGAGELGFFFANRALRGDWGWGGGWLGGLGGTWGATFWAVALLEGSVLARYGRGTREAGSHSLETIWVVGGVGLLVRLGVVARHGADLPLLHRLNLSLRVAQTVSQVYTRACVMRR